MSAVGGKLLVRPPREGDLARVVELERLSFADPWESSSLEQELHCDRLRLALVAEVSGQVAGYLMAWKIVDQLHILNIASDPARRRTGVGTALLLAAAGQAADLHLAEITLEVRAGNQEARTFYEGHGFAPTGLRRAYYADNGEDAIIMTCATSRLLEG